MKRMLIIFVMISGCRSVENTTNKSTTEKITIRENVSDRSFNVSGTAVPDLEIPSIFRWDTIINRGNKIDSIITIFNTETHHQQVKYITAKDTIRDTTYIKSDSVFIEKKVIEKVTPSWCYITIIIALLVIIGQYLYNKLRIKN